MHSCNQRGFVALKDLGEVGYMQKNATFTLNNNLRSLALLKNLMHHLCTKHIDILFHFVREHINSNEVQSDYLLYEGDGC